MIKQSEAINAHESFPHRAPPAEDPLAADSDASREVHSRPQPHIHKVCGFKANKRCVKSYSHWLSTDPVLLISLVIAAVSETRGCKKKRGRMEAWPMINVTEKKRQKWLDERAKREKRLTFILNKAAEVRKLFWCFCSFIDCNLHENQHKM